MRRVILPFVFVAVLAVSVVPALGVNGTVSVGGGSNVFSPSTITSTTTPGSTGTTTASQPGGGTSSSPTQSLVGTSTTSIPTVALVLRDVSISTARKCTTKHGHRSCVLRGMRLKVNVSSKVTLIGELKRKPLNGTGKYRKFGSVKRSIDAGTQTVTLIRTAERKKISKGRYLLTLKAVNSVGVESPTTQLSIKLS